jgi:DNA-binding transcriptional ArsR family regulator
MKVRAEQMRQSVSAAEAVLKGLANRHRLIVLCQLIEGERSVGELAEFLDLRDSTVSQHLALLRKDGFVSTRRDGQTIWYALASEPVRKLVETLYEIYCGPQAVRIAKPAPKRRSTRI